MNYTKISMLEIINNLESGKYIPPGDLLFISQALTDDYQLFKIMSCTDAEEKKEALANWLEHRKSVLMHVEFDVVTDNVGQVIHNPTDTDYDVGFN